MKTSEARKRIASLLDAGLITFEEARSKHNRIYDINTGRLYGSSISWKTQAELRAIVVGAD